MKKLLLLFAPLFFLFVTVTSPAFAGTPTFQTEAKIESFKKEVAPAKEVKKTTFFQKVKNAVKNPLKAAGDSQIVAILLALFLGSIGIHRVYLGGSGLLILGYLLLTFLFGLGGILALIDLIAIAVNGTGPFEGNNKLLAAFDAFK